MRWRMGPLANVISFAAGGQITPRRLAIGMPSVTFDYRDYESAPIMTCRWQVSIGADLFAFLLEIHFECVEAADMAVDTEHDTAIVDEHVVDLARTGRRVRHLRREIRDFLRL